MPEATNAVFRVPLDYTTVTEALAAASLVKGTVLIGTGTFREATLKVAAGVTLLGSGESSILESDAHTVVVCTEGAVRVANLVIRQVWQRLPSLSASLHTH